MDLKYRAVLFDFDGTLMDSAPGIVRCVVETAEKFGLMLPKGDLTRTFVGPPIKLSFINTFQVSPEVADELVVYYRKIYEQSHASLESRPYDGMEALVERLYSAGVKLAVASVKRCGMINEMLDNCDMHRWFPSVCGADNSTNVPQKADIMREAIEALGVAKEDVLMVGDSGFDADGAADVGVDFCAVLWGFGFRTPADVAQYKPDYIVETVDDLERLLLG